jgi:hypothetical protein
MTTVTLSHVAGDATTFATTMGDKGAKTPLANVFRSKSTEGSKEASGTKTNLPKGVQLAVQAAETLLKQYNKLRVEVLDRSDRALWEMMGNVYGQAQQIDRSPTKRESKSELIRLIQIRDGQGIASNSSTEAILVRYVFADQSRQTRNNYTIAMEKASTMGISVEKFADFLSENGGVGKVVEAVFDFEEEEQLTAKEVSDAARAEKFERVSLVNRLYAALAHKTDEVMSFSGDVSNWVPEKPKSSTKLAEKHEPKYQKGSFVIFVTMHNPETNRFHVVQGNVFDKAYEDQLLESISNRMAVTSQELKDAVTSLEKTIDMGFDDRQQEEAATA